MKNLGRILPRALIAAVLAQVAAAALVLYLHGIVQDQQRKETEAILQRLCNQSLEGVIGVFRDSLDRAQREVVQKITAEYFLESRSEFDVLDAARILSAGLRTTAHIDRYFIWSDRLPGEHSDQVLFVVRADDISPRQVTLANLTDERGTLISLDQMGREVLAITRGVDTPRPWKLVTHEVNGKRYDLAWCRFPLPNGHEVMVGYMLDLDAVRGSFVSQEIGNLPADILRPGTGSARLALTVHDETGAIVYGRPVPTGTPSATGKIDFRFFPFGRFADEYYLTTTIPPRMWNVTLSAPDVAFAGSAPGYLVTAAAVILILSAILSGVMSVRQALALSRLQTDFVRNVTHQLKTPLTILSGALETLERLRAPGKIAEYNALVRAQVARLSRLVDQILKVARADAKPSATALVDLNGVVAKCLSEVAPAVEGKRAAIAFEAAPQPLMVVGDADALEHAVANLLENAVKYGKGDAPNEIQLRTESANGEVGVIVADTGIGIDQSELKHVLTKFYRGREVRNGTRGFGLGLAIVHAVVQSHHGRMTVKSTLGAGSEFGMYFPKARDKESPA